MKAVVQRVRSASVTVEGRVVGQIGAGLLCLVAIHREDKDFQGRKLAEKLVSLRIFNDEAGKMNLSLVDMEAGGVNTGILLISNFTVYGDASKSRRPSFGRSAGFETGKELFDGFVSAVRNLHPRVEVGEFGADMLVECVNDGPVTLIVEFEADS
jgi:D-tyrosyl-tRNA(Tyr) deacylase